MSEQCEALAGTWKSRGTDQCPRMAEDEAPVYDQNRGRRVMRWLCRQHTTAAAKRSVPLVDRPDADVAR